MSKYSVKETLNVLVVDEAVRFIVAHHFAALLGLQ
jgi:hypothetical protein